MAAALSDEECMRAALAEAAKGIGRTSPNPAVGALLMARGKIVAVGHHKRAGAAHAEVDCLMKLDKRAPQGATLYVTLEPCSTTGRTPPCTEAIVAAGIKTVVVGTLDPNPRHAGRGVEILRHAGVRVRTGVLAEHCSALNRAFNKWIRTGKPYVIAKCGMTLDGRLTLPKGEQRWITSPAARRHANRRRAIVDAILVGAETVRADNPRLTVRRQSGARQPWRVVLTRSRRLPKAAHLFTDSFSDRTLVFQKRSLAAVLSELGQRDLTSVLIEGGGDVLGQAFDDRLIDAVELYVAPRLAAGPVIALAGAGAASQAEAVRLCEVHYERISDDIFISGVVDRISAESE